MKESDWALLRERLGIGSKWEPKVVPKVAKLPEPDLPLASSSTPHPAGSVEKIAVMRQRAANGRSIFHPGDNRDVLVRQSHSHVG